ncbi:non-specific lipid-transfer protein 1-like [Pyrus ussuriensis x Pyrus communis]|uniref:Non-specific lipid-transfer protein 1-like n=1 Tax=Pyrus ussuriensis x Pyrus communis TaxID=2448454 RepID=A0A5N5FWD7_9ROSA|nr:non-specific lipid-transfer protein 1-like [Pyrus ussuriensis x Pyrus communis]
MPKTAVSSAAFTVVLLSMLVTAPYTVNATVTCGQVVTLLTPCIPFGVFGGDVPPDCCAGIKGLHDIQNTAEDRRTACSCIQKGAAMIPGLDYDRVNTLGDRCGSPCPYTVYPSTNCSEVN